jgi:hypothetical protein
MWSFSQGTGKICRDGALKGRGYSGFGAGKNNPALEREQGVGPLPRGRYKIGIPYNHKDLGPVVMNLDPLPGTETFGRSLFRVHGDSIANPGSASHGCIVLNRIVRNEIAESGDHELEVT